MIVSEKVPTREDLLKMWDDLVEKDAQSEQPLGFAISSLWLLDCGMTISELVSMIEALGGYVDFDLTTSHYLITRRQWNLAIGPENKLGLILVGGTPE